MNILFEGKTAIVTGAAGGIGYAITKLLLQSKAQVVMIGTKPEKLYHIVDELHNQGKIHSFLLDITDTNAIKTCVKQIRQKIGEIDILIQAAGLIQAANGLELQQTQWDLMMNTNARGLFFMMQQVVAQSMIHRGGSIVNLSSMAGIRGMIPAMAAAHYSASKGAVIALTKQAAVEWAKYNIRVNAIAPGGVKTSAIKKLPPSSMENMNAIPLRQLSEPEDIANLAVFLASEASKMITGQTIIIDGGSSIVGF